MTTNYAGIDYGLGKTNIDANGIRYGVISQNSLNPEAFDDIWTHSRDLSYENAVAECKKQIARLENESDLADFLKEHFNRRCNPVLWAQAILGDITLSEENNQETIDAIWSEVEQTFNDSYEDNGERDWLYESDGYKLANCLQSDVFVLASPYFTYAQFCSPCVPGACNLDSPLGMEEKPTDCHLAPADNRCYCLGHDWFDGGKAPYLVYCVATGQIVQPDSQVA